MPRYTVLTHVVCDDEAAASRLAGALDAERRLSAFSAPRHPGSVFVRTDVRARTARVARDRALARVEGRLDGATVQRCTAQRLRRTGFLTWSSDPGDQGDEGGDAAGDRAPVR